MSYPWEKYIELDNNPYLLGRIIVNQVNQDFLAEIDIIHRESHKIFKHVETLYRQPSGDEALITGIQKLRHYLESLETFREEIPNKQNLH